jgi:hypothetical protein
MSAWRVGADVTAPPVAAQRDIPPAGAAANKQKVQTILDQVTKWIPGDAIALYGAAVTAWASSHGPSVILLVIAVVGTGVIVILSAFANGTDIPKKTYLAAGLAAAAFAIWSLSIPGSGWQKWHVVNENQALVAVVAAVLALLFGYLAEGLTKRYGQ